MLGRLSMDETVLRQTLQEIEDRVQESICPIYSLDERARPYQMVSAVLLNVTPYSFLLTAAHVLDNNRQSTLYIAAGEDELVILTGESYRIPVPAIGRKGDRFDFGFILLRSTIKSRLTRFKFLKPKDIDANDVVASQTLYGFVGYPGTKNKRRSKRTFKLSSQVFGVTAAPIDSYNALGLNPGSHFVRNFDRRRMVDRRKGLVTGPMPHGMSGGGVWRLGRYPELVSGIQAERLIGIGIEYPENHKVLIGVRMSLVVAAIVECYPETSASLPRVSRIKVNVTAEKAPQQAVGADR